MKADHNSGLPLFGLIDGAAHYPLIHDVLTASGARFLSVFAGMPEEALGAASFFVFEIDDPAVPWVTELDRADEHLPCLSLIRSRVGLEDMATHLRAFLLADMGDGMTALIRYYDPRNIEAVLKAWGEPVQRIFMSPIQQWLYRGRHPAWQSVLNDSADDARICKSLHLRFDQAELDALAAHTEPDEVLHSLIKNEFVDGTRPYLTRFSDFLPRYRQALNWGLAQPADRLQFCEHTYLYGPEFDRHPYVQESLLQRKANGRSYEAAMQKLPGNVWTELASKDWR